MDLYADNVVRKYTYWTVYVTADQGFLGRAIIWCNRENALELTDATLEERRELFEIMVALRGALSNAFGATWFNYNFMGNVDRHLHCHVIPRYQAPVRFMDVLFTDPDYNANPYKLEATHVVSKEVLAAIRDRLATEMV